MSEIKPKPCLCGGEAIIYNPTDTGYIEDFIGYYYCVECEKCGRNSGIFDTDAEAVEAWNRGIIKNERDMQ